MDRRSFIKLVLATGAGLLVKPKITRASAQTKTRKLKWSNWSGGLQSSPQIRFVPESEKELRAILKKAPAPIRAVGAGHSFSPLVPSDGSLLSLDLMDNVFSIGKDKAKFGGGARLRNLSRKLASKGLAFRNLPDIDKQSLAGAVSTATHGTGMGFGSLSAEIKHLRFITAQSEVLECSNDLNKEIFLAAKTSLGVLGVLTQITMNLTSSYRLRRRTWLEPYGELIARAENLFLTHDRFEFYYLPFLDCCLAIAHDKTNDEITKREPSVDDEGLAELMFLRDWFFWSNTLRKTLGASAIAEASTENIVGESYELLSTPREVRFNEMEYHLPAKNGLAALDEIKQEIEKNHRDIFIPIEVRYIKGDDGWLSPFQGGDRISVAVHTYYKESYGEVFNAIEKIFLRLGGRPHWGKINFLTKKDFARIYPDWEKFFKLRKELDGEGKFLNTYLKKLFE